MVCALILGSVWDQHGTASEARLPGLRARCGSPTRRPKQASPRAHDTCISSTLCGTALRHCTDLLSAFGQLSLLTLVAESRDGREWQLVECKAMFTAAAERTQKQAALQLCPPPLQGSSTAPSRRRLPPTPGPTATVCAWVPPTTHAALPLECHGGTVYTPWSCLQAGAVHGSSQQLGPSL